MAQAQENMLKVQSEVRLPVGIAQLVHFNVLDPVDMVMFDRETYWLALCLSPRPSSVRACYRDHWSSRRFERLGKVYLLPPGETVQTRNDGVLSHTSVLCHLNPDTMLKWFDGESPWQWGKRQLEASLDIADPNVRYLLARLAEELRHPGLSSEPLVEHLIAQVVIELGRYFTGFDEIASPRELTPWRLRLIDERLQELHKTPTLDELAALCEISVRQLTRGFRAARGCSIGDYVANSRIDHAKRLLAQDQSVKTIAYSLGFSSPSGFCFAFRRATGMTPGEFRRTAQR